MADSVIRGNSIAREARFDLDGVLTDPALPLVTIRNPLGVAVVTGATPSRIGTGIYQYAFACPIDAPLGIWQDEWSGVISGQSREATGYFEVLPVGAVAPVPSSTYTYNLATDVGRVRLLIQDHDMSLVSTSLPLEQRSAAFTDEEVQFFLDTHGDVRMAAAGALRAWANSKQLIVIARRTGRTSVDYGSIRSDLLSMAKEYDRVAIEAPADGYAEQTWTDFALRQVLWNEYMREAT